VQSPFLVPHSPEGQPLPRNKWAAEQLRNHLTNMEQIHELLVSSQAQHLDELSALNRMAQALSERRCYDEVVNDMLHEVVVLSSCEAAWMIDCTDENPVAGVHVLDDPVIGPSSLPKPVRLLCERAHRHADAIVRHVSVKGPTSETVYVGLPVATAKHMVGCLVLKAGSIDLTRDEHTRRLITSMLRQAAIACENDRLIEGVGEMMVEVVYAFARAVESRDPYTGGHVQRVTAYAMELGRRLGLGKHDLALIQMGGLLHDIGKIAIPDEVLRKPNKLTDEEFAIIKSHPACGYDLLSQIPHLSGSIDIVRHHHERWDGRGYPDKIAGEDIHLLSRIMAIADSFDAMTSDRPYRAGMPFEQAMAEIRSGAGSQFDPRLAEVFLNLSKRQLESAAQQMKLACESSDHPNTINVSGVLELKMRRAVGKKRRAAPSWEMPGRPLRPSSPPEAPADANSDQAQSDDGESAKLTSHNDITLYGTALESDQDSRDAA